MARPMIGLPTAGASGTAGSPPFEGLASFFFSAFSAFSAGDSDLRLGDAFCASVSPSPVPYRTAISSRVMLKFSSRRSSSMRRTRSSRSPFTVSSTFTGASKISRTATASRGPTFCRLINCWLISSGITSVRRASSPSLAGPASRSWLRSICQSIRDSQPRAAG